MTRVGSEIAQQSELLKRSTQERLVGSQSKETRMKTIKFASVYALLVALFFREWRLLRPIQEYATQE